MLLVLGVLRVAGSAARPMARAPTMSGRRYRVGMSFSVRVTREPAAPREASATPPCGGSSRRTGDRPRRIPPCRRPPRALLAHLGAHGAGAFVELGPELHEVGAGTADFGAGQHQPEM